MANQYFDILFETLEGKTMTTETRAAKILEILENKMTMPKWAKSEIDPFETLVVTIISQNTADINTARAFENLSKHFEITPQALSKAETKKIEDCIRVAGLYHSKTKTMQNTAKTILEKYHGSLTPILSLPFSEARKTLTELPGIGPKTADVVLLFAANQATIPVDTHVNRLAKRLGFAPKNGDYETVRQNLQSLFQPKDYRAVHILLIALGRKYCKARKPKCPECPINTYCPSNNSWDEHD